MDSSVVIERVWLSEEGRCVNYQYRAVGNAAKYFEGRPTFYARYESDLSDVPTSILMIPLVANLAPIAWFAGFDLYVPDIDEEFYEAANELRGAFNAHHPRIGSGLPFIAGHATKNRVPGDGTGLLFSGGLDSFESLTRHLDEDPCLISVLGADIAIDDVRRWGDFERYNEGQPIVRNQRRCKIESNIRDFYTAEVDLLVGLGWWGKIQHGMGLLGLVAPLSSVLALDRLLIASSNTSEVNFGWGSSPEVDERVRWAGLRVVHDGYHLRRTEKVAGIVDFAEKTGEYIRLRVCYSEHREGYNCSQCPKCQRTMLAFLLENADPGEFGFRTPANIYDLILANFPPGGCRMTVGVRYEWLCLQEKARTITLRKELVNLKRERELLQEFCGLDLAKLISIEDTPASMRRKMVFRFVKRFPKIALLYLRIRKNIGR